MGGPSGRTDSNRVVDEHFVPGENTNLLGAFRLGDTNAVHHLIRYEWAARCLADVPVSTVLDLAAGSGYGAHTIAARFPSARVKGVDYDAEATRGMRLLSTACGRDQNDLQPEWHAHKLEYSAASLYDFLSRYSSAVIRPEAGVFRTSKCSIGWPTVR